jgi:hypothetical protein
MVVVVIVLIPAPEKEREAEVKYVDFNSTIIKFYFLTTKVNILSLKNNNIVKVLKFSK